MHVQHTDAHADTVTHIVQNVESLLALLLGFVLIYGRVWKDTSVARLRERRRDRLRSGMNQLGLP